MKTIFFDCKNGISGDMVLKALMDLSGRHEVIEEALNNEHLHTRDDHDHGHSHTDHSHSGDHDHHHTHGRSWLKVRELIDHSSFSDEAKQTAISIYQNIAEAEASVHGETLETIHFHEVGRDEAIKNTLGIGMALEAIKNSGQDVQGADQQLEILTSPICDGKGTIVCSHGEIPVPVPAVMALRAKCTYAFETADVNMEMVTPSGLASLMGIKAKPAVKTLQQILEDPRVKLVAETEAKGTRDTGRDGLRVYLLEVSMSDNIPSDRREQ